MQCDDDIRDWLPVDLWLKFQRENTIVCGSWVLNLDTIETNMRWCDKPNDELLLLEKSDSKVYWSRRTRQYKLYDQDGKELDSAYSLRLLGKPNKSPTLSYRRYSSNSYNNNKAIISLAETALQQQRHCYYNKNGMA